MGNPQKLVPKRPRSHYVIVSGNNSAASHNGKLP